MGRHKKRVRDRRVEIISARVPKTVYDQIQGVMQKRVWSMGEVIRQAMKSYLHRKDQDAA